MGKLTKLEKIKKLNYISSEDRILAEKLIRKYERLERDVKTSVHHLIPRSRWGSNHNNNLSEMRDNEHRALHSLFYNQTPTEQIQTLIDLNESSFKIKYKNLILDVVHVIDEEWYKDECFN